jgi:hypothetical protein
MLDLTYLLSVIGFFAVTVAIVAGLERLKKGE